MARMTREQMIDEAVRRTALLLARQQEHNSLKGMLGYVVHARRGSSIRSLFLSFVRTEFSRIASMQLQYTKPGLLPHGVRWPVNTDPGGLTWIDA